MTLDYLSIQHPHIRDSQISFNEIPHIYTIAGDSSYKSVTTWNKYHFAIFDADLIIEKIQNSNKSSLQGRSKTTYYGMSNDEIKATWEKARNLGTELHRYIECFYNKCGKEINSIEYKYFLKFAKDYSYLKPYRTEWMIYDEKLKLAGSIDMVFEKDDGTLAIYDWKRSREIRKTSNNWALTDCISHLPDCNFWHYSLQLNIYKAILERNYNRIVSELYLVCLHENNSSYRRIKVPILTEEINSLLQLREKEIT